MGSGSSRGFGAQRRRGPHSPAVPGRGPGAATGAATVDRAPSTAAPPDGRAEALRLLDLLLAESAAWGAEGPPPEVSRGQRAEDNPEGSHASEAPGDSPKQVARRSSISYDQAEEELMASIEREYGC